MTHADLIDRLKAGSGPDRELDALVWCALRHDSKPDLLGSPDGKCTGWILMGENAVQHRTPEYTASLDACIGLMREVLPGWVIVTLTNGMIDPKYMDVREYVSWRVCLAPKKHMEDPMECIGWPDVYHTDLPRALLIAILQAVGDRHD